MQEPPFANTSGLAVATISRQAVEPPISSRRINPETDATYDLDSNAINRVMSRVL